MLCAKGVNSPLFAIIRSGGDTFLMPGPGQLVRGHTRSLAKVFGEPVLPDVSAEFYSPGDQLRQCSPFSLLLSLSLSLSLFATVNKINVIIKVDRRGGKNRLNRHCAPSTWWDDDEEGREMEVEIDRVAFSFLNREMHRCTCHVRKQDCRLFVKWSM